MALAVYQIAQQGDVLVSWLKKAGESGVEVPEWVSRLPIAAEGMQQWWRANLSDPKAATAWLRTINAENVSDLFTAFGGQRLHRLFLILFSLLFCWGAIVMLAGDHFVWPTLVGGSARLPFLLAFLGIFGGLAAFGLIGLFLGPVIMAARLTVWREWVFRPPAHEKTS